MSAQVNNFTKQEKFLLCQWQAKKNFVTWYTDCSSFYLLKYCLVICRIIGILQITYFYPYPRIRISFPEKNPSIAARLSAWKDRIECVSGNFWNKWIPLYCSLNSPKFLWCRSDREEYVSFVDLCNLYRSSWSFNLRLPFKKEDGDQWSSCAGKVSVFHLFVFLVANFARFTWQQLACNSVAISLDYWRIKWYWKSGGH